MWQTCPDPDVDFRQRQCMEFNNHTFQGTQYEWEAYIKGEIIETHCLLCWFFLFFLFSIQFVITFTITKSFLYKERQRHELHFSLPLMAAFKNRFVSTIFFCKLIYGLVNYRFITAQCKLIESDDFPIHWMETILFFFFLCIKFHLNVKRTISIPFFISRWCWMWTEL